MEVATVPSLAGTSANPRKSLEDAIEAFQAILTDDDRRKLSSIGAIRDPYTVQIFTAQLERANQLKKGRGIGGRFLSFLESVQAFSDIVDTFVSSHPDIAALVWGSVKLALLITVNYTSYFESLSMLFKELSNQCPRFAEYQALYETSTRLQTALCNFHASIVLCWQEHLKIAFLTVFKQEFEPDIQEIHGLGKEVKDEIKLAKAQTDPQDQILQEKERSRRRRLFPRVERGLDSFRELQVQQSKRRLIEVRQRLLESLSSHCHRTPFTEARKKHHCSTAQWIFTTPEFTRWYKGTGSVLLWCSGKTPTSSTMSTLTRVIMTVSHSFFSQYNNSDSLMAETIIRSIIRQSIDPTTLPEHIERQLRVLDQEHFVQLRDWTSLLRRCIENSTTFFIFIDGRDECDAPERRALLDALSSVASTTSGLRIFIASRDSDHIDLNNKFSHMERVSMAPANLESDIRVYVEATIQERIRNNDLGLEDPHLLNDIRDTLTRQADGMFLWVTFLINEVCTASCDDDVRQSLRSLPKDLEETFARALSRIISRQKRTELVQKVFQWVTVAKRSLTLGEIREAVSIEVGQPHLKTERLVREMSPVILWCENLLQLTEEEPQSLHFAHSTIYDFMTKGDLPSQLTNFHVDLEKADHVAGEICLTYLHLSDFHRTVAWKQKPLRGNPIALAGTSLGGGPKVARIATRVADAFGYPKAKADLDLIETLVSHDRAHGSEGLQQSHPFLKNAAEHWISHTSDFQEGRSSTWKLWYQVVKDGHPLASRPWQRSTFHQNEETIVVWSHRMHHYTLLRYAISIPGLSDHTRISLMKISASEGDEKAIAGFLDTGCSIVCKDRTLQAASTSGYMPIVERLINAGANVNATADERGPTALQAASGGGHLEVVKRLINAGADVNSKVSEGGRTALQIASKGGHLQVVERLLQARADINATTGWEGRTALQEASEGGHLQIVERLLNAGAKQSPSGGTGR